MAYDLYRDQLRKAGKVGGGCKHCKSRSCLLVYYDPSWSRLASYCLTCSWKEPYVAPVSVQIWTNEARIRELEARLRRGSGYAPDALAVPDLVQSAQGPPSACAVSAVRAQTTPRPKISVAKKAETTENPESGNFRASDRSTQPMTTTTNTNLNSIPPTAVPLPEVPANDWLTTPADFLALHEYPTPGHYLNDCDENADVETEFGTLALCFAECILSPGETYCEHGCPSARAAFESLVGGDDVA